MEDSKYWVISEWPFFVNFCKGRQYALIGVEYVPIKAC